MFKDDCSLSQKYKIKCGKPYPYQIKDIVFIEIKVDNKMTLEFDKWAYEDEFYYVTLDDLLNSTEF